MWEDAWTELEELPPEHRAALPVLLMRLESLTALKRWENAAVLAERLIVKRCRSMAEAETLLLSGEEVLQEDALWHYNPACYASVPGRIAESKEQLARAFAPDQGMRAGAFDDEDLEAVCGSTLGGL